MLDSLLLAAVRVSTFTGSQLLTGASGFLFAQAPRLFLVTSRHVLFDDATKHYPDRIEIELHCNPSNLSESVNFSIPLYRTGRALWHQGFDAAGEVDVAVIPLDQHALPPSAAYFAFTADHLAHPGQHIEIGSSLLVVGFPLGFHDTLHHMPVVRHAVLASAFGLRFQGHGYFLTDARMHRGTSGAPVVMRAAADDLAAGELPWRLLGIHSGRFEVGTRDLALDDTLALNCVWYSDILLTLTRQ